MRAMQIFTTGTVLGLLLLAAGAINGCAEERTAEGTWLCAQGCPDGLECGCDGTCVEAGTVGVCPPGSQGAANLPDVTLGSLSGVTADVFGSD